MVLGRWRFRDRVAADGWDRGWGDGCFGGGLDVRRGDPTGVFGGLAVVEIFHEWMGEADLAVGGLDLGLDLGACDDSFVALGVLVRDSGL